MSWAVATVDWLRRLYGDWRGLRDDTFDTLDEMLNPPARRTRRLRRG